MFQIITVPLSFILLILEFVFGLTGESCMYMAKLINRINAKLFGHFA